MGEQFVWTEQTMAGSYVDVASLAQRLDRSDILLLKQFYHTGRDWPDDTESHVLCLLVDKLHHLDGPLARLSYGAIRRRLENLVALGLLGKIPQTNPAVFEPLDPMAEHVRRIIVRFAADFVGLCRQPW